MPGDHDPGATVLLDPTHRTQSPSASVVGLDVVVGILLGVMPCRRPQLVQDARVTAARSVTTSKAHRSAVARSKKRRAALVTPYGNVHVDHLAELVNRPGEIGPAAGDFT